MELSYKGFRIKAYEAVTGRWRVRIHHTDGYEAKLAAGHNLLHTTGETFTEQAAIGVAKALIDDGGVIRGAKLVANPRLH
jgi:hypothetical protein